jgi:uncharacterized protein with HEPN domain
VPEQRCAGHTFEVDDLIVWRTAQHYLPALKAEVEGLLAEGANPERIV